MPAKEYFKYKKKLIPDILKAYNKLADKHDIIVLEGAGSPAEINLKKDDIVNMGMAKLVDAPVLLVGDIDRGGVFAQLAGTVMLLEKEERARIRGMIINKFRGDVSILKPGLDEIENICKIPVTGVVPYVHLDIDDEDSLSERLNVHSDNKNEKKLLDIAVIRLPHISNFTDFNALSAMEGVGLRYVESPEQLGEPDLIIIPGTKNTIYDLKWLRQNGLEALIKKKSSQGTLILGICGGYQMLGRVIDDSCHAETGEKINGIGLLPIATKFSESKHRTRMKGNISGELGGAWSMLGRKKCSGYEIHMGVSHILEDNSGAKCFTMLTNQLDKSCVEEGCVLHNAAGTYLHGIFDEPEFTNALAVGLCKRKGINYTAGKTISFNQYKQREYDKLADAIRENIDMKQLYEIIGV
jgi:adenosylcobyric acid synthase